MNERELIKGIAYSLRKSHSDIAESVGVSQTSVTRMLNGDTAMRIDKLATICEAIGAEIVITRGRKSYSIHTVNGEVVISGRFNKGNTGADEGGDNPGNSEGLNERSERGRVL